MLSAKNYIKFNTISPNLVYTNFFEGQMIVHLFDLLGLGAREWEVIPLLNRSKKQKHALANENDYHLY